MTTSSAVRSARGPAQFPPFATPRGERRVRRLPNGDVAHPAGSVLGAILVALVLGLFLNANSIYVKAGTQPDGWRRQVGLAVMGPVRAVSRATLLDRPRTMLENEFRDKSPARHTGSAFPVAVTSTTVAPPVVRLRVPSRAAPLHLWVGGDSMAQVFGQSVVAKGVDRGDIDATLDYRISTGLTERSFFDWPTHLQDAVLPTKPEVIIIMFGANDAQSMDINGEAYDVRSPVWQAEYRQRVAATMEQLSGDGRLVVWVGQPIMRSPNFTAREAILDEIYRDEASRRPWIRFVDSRPILASDGTTYSAYLPGSNGAQALMRQGDGIHLSRAGGDRLAEAVLAVVDAETAKAATAGRPPSLVAPTRPPILAGPAPPVTVAPINARPSTPPTTRGGPPQLPTRWLQTTSPFE